MEGANGKTCDTIKGANTFTYLGIQLGRSTGIKLHWEGKKKTIKRQVNIIKAQAGESFNRLLTGRGTWNQAIKQKALFGTEIAHTPKPWINDMEATQKKVAKWLTRVKHAQDIGPAQQA